MSFKLIYNIWLLIFLIILESVSSGESIW